MVFAVAMYPQAQWESKFARLALRSLGPESSSDGVYDATQALMALMALVVVTNERNLFERIPDLSRKQMLKNQWPIHGWTWNYEFSEQDLPAGRKPDGLHAFIRNLRHALTHGQFEFLGDDETLNGVVVNTERGGNHIRGHWVGFQVRMAAERLGELIQTQRN